MTSSSPLRGHLDGLVLAVLRDGPVHGYGIADALRQRSDGVLDVAEGSLYPALYRMERQGLVRSRWDHGERRRRVYELTSDGGRAAETERRAWRTFSSAVDAVIGGGPTGQPA